MNNKQNIGFIGLGMMGHGMAKNLLAKGYALRFVAHRNRANLGDLLDAGAVECKSHRELAQGCEALILCVTGSPQVEQIVHAEGGLLAAVRKGHAGHRLLDRRAGLEPAHPRGFRRARRGLRRRAAGAHAEGGRRRAPEHDGRRVGRRLRARAADPGHLLREHHPRRPGRAMAMC